MAHKKGQGSTRNGRDSRAQRLGIKKFGGEAVIPGNIIVRQCGTKWRPGRNVGLGSDYTIFALVEGKVYFDQEGRRVNVEVAPSARRLADRNWMISRAMWGGRLRDGQSRRFRLNARLYNYGELHAEPAMALLLADPGAIARNSFRQRTA